MSIAVRRFATSADMADAAASRFCTAAAAAVAARGRFCAIVPGGRTPVLLYRALRESPWRTLMPWRVCHLMLSDERCAAASDAASNFRLLQQELLAHVPVPPAHWYRVPVDAGPPAAVAEAWECAMREFFGAVQWPDFDLAVLGVGADGHTASIFPGDAAPDDAPQWTAAVAARGTPAVARVSLTLPAINAAREALFFAAGAGKAPVVKTIESRDPDAGRRFPAARVAARGATTWFFAEAGAG